MSNQRFVGRDGAIGQLQSVLKGEVAADGRLTILSIEGPGGIGKTCLLDHVLLNGDFTPRNYLTLRVDGGGDTPKAGLFAGIDHFVDSARAKAVQTKPSGYYFPTVKESLQTVETLRQEVLREFDDQSRGDQEARDLVSCLVDGALRAGKWVNQVSPLTAQYLNVTQIQQWQEKKLETRVPAMSSVRPSKRWLGGILPDLFSVSLRNALKGDPTKVVAEAMLSDLSAILSGYQFKEFLKPRHPKLPDTDRLLLVIDDYEGLVGQWESFVVEHLLPGLRAVKFESVVILLGRDRLEATHSNWGRNLKGSLVPRIELGLLTREETYALVENHGVVSPTEKERAWKDTLGYPYYLQLWLEEQQAGGRSAVALMEVFDRTTTWISARQKRWLECTLFLDDVDKRTLLCSLDNPAEVDEALAWFKKEGSVRDTHKPTFRVLDFRRFF